MSGKLSLVATPIGNLGDITLRALETLKAADLIACEDTRHSAKLLQHYEIRKPLLSLHEHNERARVAAILAKLEEGAHIALVSDAGTPLISDPGFRLARAVVEAGHELESLPGPCAAINALLLSGLPTDSFYFVGFLPPKSAARRRRFQELADFPSTLIFYESPHRIRKFLDEAFEILGPRPIAVAREMTKKFEEIYRGPLKKADEMPLRSWKGEFAVLVAPDNSQ
ncbi:MAG TPA: 16S rRNA (cytidine(1402)-2'-O)-methyltransferase [bacterium]|nr:16S rRNA (cytidine(1402)-2'-O)-methyltransferase [bacterium]